MSSEVINVGKLMRQESYLRNGKRGKTYQFKMSAKAVQEEISFLKAKIEGDVFAVCERHFNEAKRKHNLGGMKKTVMPDDIVMVNGFVNTAERKEVE